MINKIHKTILGALLAFPTLSYAQLEDTRGLLEEILSIITNVLVPLVFILALLYFFWGVAKYIRSEGQGKAEGKNIMVWGVIALFVMSSVWGLVWFIKNELGVGHETVGTIPTVEPASGGSTRR